MANFGQLLLTNLGIQEQYKAQAGGTLKFKRIAMGSGKFTGNIMAMSKLVSESVSVDISKGYMQNNAYVVEGFFSNEGLQTGFAWREIGLFVENADGKEILYCYANAGDSYDFIPATADERYSKYIRIATAIGNATSVTFVESEGLLAVDTRTFNAAVAEFRTDIDSLWPSKIASGESVIIKDSAALPFLGMRLYGKSTQVNTSGKNLLNIKEVYPSETSSVVWNGEALTITGYLISMSVYGLTEGETYTLSYKSTRTGDTGGGFAMEFRDGSESKISGVYKQNEVGNKSYSFTVPDGTTRLLVFLYASNSTSGTTSATYSNVQLEAGYEATEYESYTGGTPSPSIAYPQELIHAGADGEIEVKVCGKNLLDISKVIPISYEKITRDGNAITIAAGNNIYGLQLTDALPTLEVGKTYVFSIGSISNHGVQWGFRFKTAAGIWSNTINESVWVFTVTEPIVQVNLYAGFNLTFTEDVVITNIQCEIGEAATEFEEYAEQTLAVSTPNGLAGIESVCDEKDFGGSTGIQRIKLVELTGTEAWVLYTANERINQFYTLFKDVHIQNDTVNAMSNMFRGITLNQRDRNFGTVYTAAQSNNTFLCFNTMEFATVDEWKAFLAEKYAAGTPVKVAYKLATPITTYLSASEIEAYKVLSANNPNTTIVNDSGAGLQAEYVTKTFEAIFKGAKKQTLSDVELMLANVASVQTVTTEEFKAIENKDSNTLYLLTDAQEDSGGGSGGGSVDGGNGYSDWTDEDKTAIVNDVLAALPKWTGGNY